MLLFLGERNGSAVIVVADDGPGNDPTDRARVLQRFYRAERSRQREGVGLGLSLVAAIATLHGFRLTIGDNHPGCRVELTCGALTDTAPMAGEVATDLDPTKAVDAAQFCPVFSPPFPLQPTLGAATGKAVTSENLRKHMGQPR